MDTKICVACKQEKILTEFYTHKRSPKGRTSRCKECKKKYLRQPEHLKTRRNWLKNKKDNDPAYKLIHNLGTRVRVILRGIKTDRTIEFLGCSSKEWVVYLEKQFDSNMNWENYGTYWEVDHIVPLSKGGSFHYTNTQPLSVTENRSKGNRVE